MSYDAKPITYRGYTIERAPSYTRRRYQFTHKDYDGAPWETGGPPMDKRHGHADSVQDAKDEIDDLEDA